MTYSKYIEKGICIEIGKDENSLQIPYLDIMFKNYQYFKKKYEIQIIKQKREIFIYI